MSANPMTEYQNPLLYREAVECYSPGSLRNVAPWVLDGNQRSEPQRSSSIEQREEAVEPRWGSENPVAVAPRVRYATLGYGIQRRWRKDSSRFERSPTSYVDRLLLIVLAVLICTLPMAHVLAQDAEEQAAELAALADPQMQLLKQYVRVNCALARRVCKLSGDQEQQLAKMNDEWLAAEIKHAMGVPVKAPAVGIAQIFGFAQPAPVLQPFEPHQICAVVQKVIDTKIEGALDSAQVIEYRREREERDQFRQEAIAGIIVSLLDKRLFFSEDQRTALQKSISRSLHNDLYWRGYLMNENFIPQIPNSAFFNILSKQQMGTLAGWQMNDFDSLEIDLENMDGQHMEVLIEK